MVPSNGALGDHTSNSQVNQKCDQHVVTSSSDPEQIRLKKELGLFSGVSIIVGSIVGSGIFVSPKGVLLYTQSWGAALTVWIACGVLSTIGALCFAELGTSIPKSGGDYAYINEAFGPLPAFLFLWGAITIIMPAGNAVAALTVSNYVLYNFFPECEAPENATRFIAAIAVCKLDTWHLFLFRWPTEPISF